MLKKEEKYGILYTDKNTGGATWHIEDDAEPRSYL